MNLKGTKSKVSKYFYQNKESVVITGSFWDTDTDYVNNIQPIHTGYDYRARTPLGIVSPNDGEVLLVVHNNRNGKDQGFGTYFMIYYPTWDVTFLGGHMSRIDIKKGDRVRHGQFIGLTGNTGHSLGAHLHVSLLKGRTTSTNKNNGLWLDVEKFDFAKLNHLKLIAEWGYEIETKGVSNIRSTPNASHPSNIVGKLAKGSRRRYTHWVQVNGYDWKLLEDGTYVACGPIGDTQKFARLVPIGATSKPIEVGSVVKIRAGAPYQGAHAGKPVSAYAMSRPVLTVDKIIGANARIKEINSWIAIKDLTA